ncbi:hypothetical protein [Nocardioides jensenii]|uniref:hypothetical protein n=1 Tax=Nocardioides jensenii TaxID=1843 RepID=UPI00082A9AB7|nr:hypothetical protein [Nocardioides jensenii]
MIRTRAVGALFLLAPALLVGGCSAGDTGRDLVMGPAASIDDSSNAAQDTETQDPPDPLATPEPPATSAEPATGRIMSGKGYQYSAPKSWVDITKQMRESGQKVDTAVGADITVSTTVRENLNVVLTDVPGVTLETYEQIAPETLAFMVKDLEVYDRAVIAGDEAVHVGGSATVGGVDFFFEQFVVVRDDTMYAVSFAINLERSDEERRAVVDSVLASWKWPS